MPLLQEGARDYARKIILLSSVGGGIQVFPGFRHSDGASKAGVAAYAKQLAADNVHTKIDVFAICPGATDTPMLQESTLNHLTAPDREKLLSHLPKRRLIHPAEVAQTIVFLASQHSTCLNGAVLDCSMGLGVRPGLITEAGGH
jgi:NAD(P)-dependent dehydrogenase (short-subunit alcohol dehydrogenase family)